MMIALVSAACMAWVVTGSRPTWRDMPVLQYHPGHPPLHVTRLHRYDHSGLAAALEAEESWHSHTKVGVSASPGSLVEVGAAPVAGTPPEDASRRFVQVSRRQAEALQQHHESVRELGSSGGSREKLRAVRRYRAQTPQNRSVTAATGLSSLESQYVGPIGVGTVVSPDGCTPEEKQSSLLYVPSNGQGSEWEAQRKNCHVEDQSQVWVVFDTGSTNIWVASDLCNHGACVQAGRSRYNHTLSSTYQTPAAQTQLHIEFGTGKIDGPQAIEDFHVGPFTVYNQTFGMIQVQDGRVFDDVPFEGILGLAFPSMSANGVTPFFDNVVRQKTLGKSEFAFYFSLDSKAGNAVFWGGVDPAFYKEPIEYFHVDDPYYWSIPLVSFKIGNETLLGEGATDGRSMLDGASKPKAIVDTGTTFFTAEGAMFDDVIRRLPAAPCHQVSDTSHPPITYTLRSAGGEPRDFVLDNTQYMTSRDSGCSPAFMRIDVPPAHGPAMVLGEVFLRHYFSVFDRGDGGDADARVGFAKAQHGGEVAPRLQRLTKHQPAFGQSRQQERRAMTSPHRHQ